MTRSVFAILALAVALAACTRKPDDSAALQKAKADTNAAVDAAKSAVVNATTAATTAATDAAKEALAKAKTAEVVDRTKELAVKARDEIERGAGKVSDKTRELAATARDKFDN